jgi:hypothetical protein
MPLLLLLLLLLLLSGRGLEIGISCRSVGQETLTKKVLCLGQKAGLLPIEIHLLSNWN